MGDAERPKKYRNFPFHDLVDALRVASTIRDVNAGRPMNRLLLAHALDIKPSSSNFRNLLSSSLKYGLTNGTEKAAEISLTDLGKQATSTDRLQVATALHRAATTPSVFSRFYKAYNNSKVPASEMLSKILVANFDVPEGLADECAKLIMTNGEKVGIVRLIAGSKHVLMDQADDVAPTNDGEPDPEKESQDASDQAEVSSLTKPGDGARHVIDSAKRSGAIFLGHGKKKGPVEKLQRLLDGFKIPYKVATGEPNLGRPIPVKVREVMLECGSAILIFTKDEKFLRETGEEVWRPSENVVHELGAASLLYEDRIVIFKEEGIDLPTNFSSIGYIPFKEDALDAKTAELLQELIGFGLVRITAA